MSLHCNLCAVSSHEECVNILSNPLLKEKVQKYLPFIDVTSKSSHQQVLICSLCKETMEEWNLFYLKCAYAQRTLHATQFDTHIGKKKKKIYCCAKFCTNTDLDEKMFYLPKNLPRGKQWLLNAGRSDLLTPDVTVESLHRKRLSLCAVHFERRMFSNELRRSLVADAVPSLFSTWKRSRQEAVIETEGRKIYPKPLSEILENSNLNSLPRNKENQMQLLIEQGNETINVVSPFLLQNDPIMTAQALSHENRVYTLQNETDVPIPSSINTHNMLTDSQVVLVNSSEVGIVFHSDDSSTQSLSIDQMQLDHFLNSNNISLNNLPDIDLRSTDSSSSQNTKVSCSNGEIINFNDMSTNHPNSPNAMEISSMNVTEFVCPSSIVEHLAQDIVSGVPACSLLNKNTESEEISVKASNDGVAHNYMTEETHSENLTSTADLNSFESTKCLQAEDPSSYILLSLGEEFIDSVDRSPSLTSDDKVQGSARTNSIQNVKLNRASLVKSKDIQYRTEATPTVLEITNNKDIAVSRSIEIEEHGLASISKENVLGIDELSSVCRSSQMDQSQPIENGESKTLGEHSESPIENVISLLSSKSDREDADHTIPEATRPVESLIEEHESSLACGSVIDYETSRLLNSQVSSRVIMYTCEFCGDTLLTEGLLKKHCKLYHSM